MKEFSTLRNTFANVTFGKVLSFSIILDCYIHYTMAFILFIYLFFFQSHNDESVYLCSGKEANQYLMYILNEWQRDFLNLKCM